MAYFVRLRATAYAPHLRPPPPGRGGCRWHGTRRGWNDCQSLRPAAGGTT